MLIQRGARINATNMGDDTALHLAASHGHRDIVLMVKRRIITAGKGILGKVMFSQACVSHSVHGREVYPSTHLGSFGVWVWEGKCGCQCPPPPRQPMKRTVCILLECILVTGKNQCRSREVHKPIV